MGFDGLSGLSEQANRRESVTETSAIAHRKHLPSFDERARYVLVWLQVFGVETDPTSAELADAIKGNPKMAAMSDMTAMRMYVRRGLSDLKAIGKAIHGERRVCKVTGETSVTWRATE